ncbi:enoyl-CoA hydratase/isomerase family protein [Phytohabitans suffuscus]|uniref:Methylglutaconyl-CoA hydratase n=1 Tax=Phytohabitans suffuscus TaxID=624315 RepID=A0A6F8YAL3_9ACTN|nr:enoyl-CoA hydratase/isomerase family protein [Phytohabitans suffuscus]BCB83063.1 methylglutaconyl-CoA hydratase [Phytohabitans suffuscus]
MAYTTIAVTVDGRGAARVTLDRPRRLNAFDDTMLRELEECARDLNDDPAVRVVTLAGEGGNFCAGRDTAELSDVGRRDSGRPIPASGGHESSMFRALEMPTVALLDGAVVGGGLGFALQCDLRIATDRVKLYDGHLRNGMAPSVASWYLPRLTTVGRALRFCAHDRPVPPRELLDLGLVDAVVPVAELDAAHEELIAPFLAADPRLLRHTKALLREAQDETYESSMRRVGLIRAVERLGRAS